MITDRQFLGGLLVVFFAFTRLAADTNVIQVTSTQDSGTGSLRDAITQANALGGGSISLSVTGVITLASSLPPLMNIELRGPGTNHLTISGNNVCRPFDVPAGSTALLSGLRISEGISSNGGGAILNLGALTIRGCLIESNRAVEPNLIGGAIFSEGSLHVSDSCLAYNAARGEIIDTFDAQGGAIYNSGSVLLERSVFA